MIIRVPSPLLATLALGLLWSVPATADDQPLPPVAAGQAERCVAVVRARVLEDGTTQLRHLIADVKTERAYRDFIIKSAVYSAADIATNTPGRTFIARCRADRGSQGVALKSIREVGSSTTPS